MPRLGLNYLSVGLQEEGLSTQLGRNVGMFNSLRLNREGLQGSLLVLESL